jgi:ribosomal protein S20
MANTLSAKKAVRKIARRAGINRSRRSQMRTCIRKVEEAIAAGDSNRAAEALRAAQPLIMRAGKIAWDPDIFDRTIHMEVFGIFRNFVDRVVLPFTATAGTPSTVTTGFINHNNDTAGGGVGGSILVPIIPRVLEAGFSGVTGHGIGRYGAAQLADVTFNPDGSLEPLQETMFLASLVWHPWPGLDIYGYAGEEYESSNFGFTPLGHSATFGGFTGEGNPAFNNSGCAIELSTVCSGNVQKVEAITGGFWQDIYRGPFGRLTGGLEYMWVKKYGFTGFGIEPLGAPTPSFLRSLDLHRAGAKT